MTLLAPRGGGDFQGYDFPNLHDSWHALVKVCKVGALMSYEISPILIFRPKPCPEYIMHTLQLKYII